MSQEESGGITLAILQGHSLKRISGLLYKRKLWIRISDVIYIFVKIIILAFELSNSLGLGLYNIQTSFYKAIEIIMEKRVFLEACFSVSCTWIIRQQYYGEVWSSSWKAHHYRQQNLDIIIFLWIFLYLYQSMDYS